MKKSEAHCVLLVVPAMKLLKEVTLQKATLLPLQEAADLLDPRPTTADATDAIYPSGTRLAIVINKM
jgi:hypothetical protein